MIIQCRGTSGSGKTWAMRQVMSTLQLIPEFISGRRRPLYYRTEDESIVVLGSYENSCGGCDGIGSARQVFDLIKILLENPSHRVILAEGLLLSEDVKWVSQLPDVRVLFLTTPLEDCLENILSRRKERGNDSPLTKEKPKGRPTADVKASRRAGVIERSRLRLSSIEGIIVRRCSSVQAPEIILRWLRESSEVQSSELTSSKRVS